MTVLDDDVDLALRSFVIEVMHLHLRRIGVPEILLASHVALVAAHASPESTVALAERVRCSRGRVEHLIQNVNTFTC